MSQFQVISFHPLRRNTLAGFATVRFSSGLILHDRAVHVHPGAKGGWVGLPATPIIDTKSGQAQRDPRGKIVYAAIAEWSERQIGDRFSEIVVGIIRERWPEAFDAGGEP
jgi:hypothetical protein